MISLFRHDAEEKLRRMNSKAGVSKDDREYGTYGGDEELRAVGVGTGVGHGEETRLGVSLLEVLICEFLAVDGLASSAAVCQYSKERVRYL